jgi:hypothetical protein
MPIRFHLNGQKFDPETLRVMGLAFEVALVALERTGGTANPTREAAAFRIDRWDRGCHTIMDHVAGSELEGHRFTPA